MERMFNTSTTPTNTGSGIIANIIGLAITSAIMPTLISVVYDINHYMTNRERWPRFTSFFKGLKYLIRIKQRFRHIRQNNVRFHFGVIIRNA